MTNSKSKKRGRLIAMAMVVMTLVPVGFSVVQGVSVYQATNSSQESRESPQVNEPVTSIMDNVQEVNEEESIQ